MKRVGLLFCCSIVVLCRVLHDRITDSCYYFGAVTEQDEIVKQISMLGEQSSLLWRVAALVLDASCFIV
jgi:hypothetical protein